MAKYNIFAMLLSHFISQCIFIILAFKRDKNFKVFKQYVEHKSSHLFPFNRLFNNLREKEMTRHALDFCE